MTGVAEAPAAITRSRHARWSSICEAHATWWTVPAPPIPGPLAGGGSKAYSEPRLSPRISQDVRSRGSNPSASSKRRLLAFVSALRGDVLAGESLDPEVERLLGGHPPGDRVDHPGACAPAAGVRVFEEGDVASGAPHLVGVEEVVDRGIVLVDGLLHQAQAQRAGVELDVPGSVRRDAGDVVDPLELHPS